MNNFFDGKILYGDNFDSKGIQLWHDQEKEAYANLNYNNNREKYKYCYHLFNKFHAFSKIKDVYFQNVLGIGSAYGDEFLPICDFIGDLTIIEPSEQFLGNKIKSIRPKYIKPNISGKINSKDNTYDLVSCLGVLHHIPNVNFVLKEIFRVMTTGGILLLREPIDSMGDWREKRKGLTKNERGIPVKYFEKIFHDNNIKVISRNYCMTATYMINKYYQFFSKKNLLSYNWYVYFDFFISTILSFNNKYHKVSNFDKIAPRAVYYVLRKE